MHIHILLFPNHTYTHIEISPILYTYTVLFPTHKYNTIPNSFTLVNTQAFFLATSLLTKKKPAIAIATAYTAKMPKYCSTVKWSSGDMSMDFKNWSPVLNTWNLARLWSTNTRPWKCITSNKPMPYWKKDK